MTHYDPKLTPWSIDGKPSRSQRAELAGEDGVSDPIRHLTTVNIMFRLGLLLGEKDAT